MKTGISEHLKKDLFDKSLQKLKRNSTHAYLAGGLLLLVIAISIYFWQTNIPTIWRPIPDRLLFALQFENIEEKDFLDKELAKLLPSNTFTQWNHVTGFTAIKESYQPQETLVAWHTEPNTTLSQLFVWRFQEQTLDSMLYQLNEKANASYIKIRQYRGEKIFNVSSNEHIFSFYRYQNSIVGSYTSLLLEASIRNISEGNYFVSNVDLPTIKAPKILLLANVSGIKNWLPSLFESFPFSATGSDKAVFDPLVMQLQWKDNGIQAQGLIQGNEHTLPDSIVNQVDLFSEVLFGSIQVANKRNNDAAILQRRALLKERFGFNADKILVNTSTAYSQFILDRNGVYQAGKIIGIALKDSQIVAQQLALLHPQEQVNKEGFTRIKQPELPSLLFSEILTGFNATFYQIKNGYLWLGNYKPQASQLEKLNQIVSEKGERLFIQNRNLLPYLAGDIARDNIERFTKLMEHIEAFFYVKNNSGTYAQILLAANKNTQKDLDTAFEVSLPQPVRQNLFEVQNHVTQETEFVWQDARSRLVLLNDTGTILWRKAVWQYAVTDIYQADIYNNQKLQYVFASEGRIHAYDRLGRTVNGFPMSLPTYFEAQYIYPFRWKNDKEQRFLLAGSVPGAKEVTGGMLYLFNRYGGLARGWSPRKLETELACAPRLVNYNGNDVFLVLLQNGSFYAFDKQGRVQPGFPLITNVSCSQAFIVNEKEGSKEVTFISDDGILITVGIDGKLIKRQSLSSRLANTDYTLVANKQRAGDYIITLQQGKALLIKDHTLRTLFNYDTQDDEIKKIAYYDFGYDKTIILVFSPKSNTCVFLNKQGENIVDEVVSSTTMPLLSYDATKQKFRVLASFKNKIHLKEWKD